VSIIFITDWLRPQAAPDSRIRRRILSAKNPPKKNTDIRIIRWNQHSNKWLACYLKWNILVISKFLVITDGCRFCNSKETDNNNYKYITYVGSHFSLGSTAQPKLFVISRILAEYFSLRDNSANSNIIWISPAIRIFFTLQIGGYRLTWWEAIKNDTSFYPSLLFEAGHSATDPDHIVLYLLCGLYSSLAASLIDLYVCEELRHGTRFLR